MSSNSPTTSKSKSRCCSRPAAARPHGGTYRVADRRAPRAGGPVARCRTEPSPELLEEFCELLSSHIRREERELFEAIQRTLPRETLDAAGANRPPRGAHLPCDSCYRAPAPEQRQHGETGGGIRHELRLLRARRVFLIHGDGVPAARTGVLMAAQPGQRAHQFGIGGIAGRLLHHIGREGGHVGIAAGALRRRGVRRRTVPCDCRWSNCHRAAAPSTPAR